jgi:predicted O-methyltransferase YrrM
MRDSKAIHYAAAVTMALRQLDMQWLPPDLLNMDGYSSPLQRLLLNRLCRGIANCRYVEVGVFKGATLLSAAYGSRAGQFVGIDNFEQGTQQEAERNVRNIATSQGNVHLLQGDFFALEELPACNVFFFDANDGKDTRSALSLLRMKDALEDPFVMIVDNWSNRCVRSNVQASMAQLGWEAFAAYQLLSDDDCHIDQWWSGWCIAVVQKKHYDEPAYVPIPLGAPPLWSISERRRCGLISVEDYSVL